MNTDKNKLIRSIYTIELILHHLQIFSEFDKHLVKQIFNNEYIIVNIQKFKKYLRKINPQFKKEINNLFNTLTVYKKQSPISFKTCRAKNKLKLKFIPSNLLKLPFEKILNIGSNTFSIKIPFHVMICYLTLNPNKNIELIIQDIYDRNFIISSTPESSPTESTNLMDDFSVLDTIVPTESTNLMDDFNLLDTIVPTETPNLMDDFSLLF